MEYKCNFVIICITIILLKCVTLGYCQQECISNDMVQKTCIVTSGAPVPVTVECPLFHAVVITSAKIEKGGIFRCPSGIEESTCQVQDITLDFIVPCFNQRTCSVTPAIPSSNPCNALQYPGGYYVRLDYKCVALHNLPGGSARAIAICTSETFSGTNIHVDSVPLVGIGMGLKETNCTCSVIVQANVELDITPLLFFEGTLAPITDCSKRIEIWEGEHHYNICSGDPVLQLGCNPHATQYDLRYVTEDSTVEVGFILELLVHHNENLTVTCGESFVPTPAPIVTTQLVQTTTEMMQTTTPEMITTTMSTTTTTTVNPTTTPTTTTVIPTTTPTTTTTTSTTTPSPTTTTTATPTPTTTTTTPPTTTTTATTPTPTTTTTTPSTTTSTTTMSTTTSTTTTPPTTTTPLLSSTTSDQTSEDQTSDNTKRIIWPIIVGILAAAILVLVICCLVIGLRYRLDNDSELFVEPEDSDKSSNFTYVTGVYVDGNNRSKLVVQNQPTGYFQSGFRSIMQ